MARDDLRHIPSIPALARILRDRGLAATDDHATRLARSIQDRTRAALLVDSSRALNTELNVQVDRVERLLGQPRFRRVINATGVLIHTNLGRAAVSDVTSRAMSEAAASAVALEIQPETGRRGGRMAEIADLLRVLTSADAALVVNNNAAATLLTLTALAAGRGVAVSRAEAVEIGGGFRIPDVLRQSGAELIEVGTTNRTYADDYRQAAIGDGGVILKVHSSNFSISGFTAHPSLAELREVADERGALLIEDLGSGTLMDTARFGVDHEPTVGESLAAGVDVVTFSGDKLLGGPQAGIIAGRADLVESIATAPLGRALRADKVTLAGIAATLRHYVRGDAEREIPLLRMMSAPVEELRARGAAIAAGLPEVASVVETTNFVGGGSLPGQALPGIALKLRASDRAVDEVARDLRLDAETPVYGRVEEGHVLIELRTVRPDDDAALEAAIRRAVRWPDCACP